MTMKKKSTIEKAVNVAKAMRLDGWMNVLTGLGTKSKDRRESSSIEWCPMTEREAETLYSASDTAGKIVDDIVRDSFREGYTLSGKEEFSPELVAAIKAEKERLQVDDKMIEAWITARIQGGSMIIAIPRNVKDLSQPLVPESVQEIKNLLVLSRWELSNGQIEHDPRSPNFGRPSTYLLSPKSAGGGSVVMQSVHYTRCLRFDGAHLPKQNFIQNSYWHDSVLNKSRVAIRDYDGAISALSSTLDDFSIGVMKISGLRQLIAEDKDDLVTKRLEIVNMGKSVAKMAVVDAEGESFEYQNRSLAGVGDAIDRVSGRLVVASGMPHTKILGESPDGSNATGNSTSKDWYDAVKAAQTSYLNARLITLWTWILAAKAGPTGGKVPEGLKATYIPLWQEPASILADVRLKTSQADASDITNGILDPNEVAISRYGSGKYSTETQLIAERTEPTEDPKVEAERKAKEEAAAQAKAMKAAGGGKDGSKPFPPKKGT